MRINIRFVLIYELCTAHNNSIVLHKDEEWSNEMAIMLCNPLCINTNSMGHWVVMGLHLPGFMNLNKLYIMCSSV